MLKPGLLCFLLHTQVFNRCGVSAAEESPAISQLKLWKQSNPADTSKSADHPSNVARSQHGIPMPSLTSSQAVGINGPILLQDSFLIEKTASFNRERIPERVVHAKGAGAFGYFEVTDDVSHLTKAKVFNGLGKQTNVAVRFSTVGGEAGSGDTWIDPKGFATKFYTEDGIYDLVGNNIEIFPIRDPMVFADLNRSRKRNPATHLRDPTMFIDFTSLRPESALHTLHLFSDMGTPASLRFMNGAGVHTFKWVNSQSVPVYIKYHWRSNQPYKYLTKEESLILAGTNPDYLIQDLYDSIAKGEYPSWDLYVQVMTFDQANHHPQNPFDTTKHWRREEYPLFRVGKMTLNRNPSDYFSQVESIAFSPANMVPGVEASPDRMLHARMFSYPDAQRYRLGVNFAQLPVNRGNYSEESRASFYRDGLMAVGSNGEGSPNYYPNSFGGPQDQSQGVCQTTFLLSGIVDRLETRDDDNFSQSALYLQKDLDPPARRRLVENLADFLSKADPGVQEQFLQNIAVKISAEFGSSLRNALGVAKAVQKDKVTTEQI